MILFKPLKLKKPGFTMVELMLAMVILSIGIVALLRSFLSVVNALALTSDKLAAISILESKVSKLQEQAMLQGGLRASETEENILVGGSKAGYRAKVSVREPAVSKDIFDDSSDLAKNINITESVLSVSWETSFGKRSQIVNSAFFEAPKMDNE